MVSLADVQPARNPADLARAKWRSSGLSDEQAEVLHFKALTALETKSLGPNFEAEASLKIPYFEADGTPISFFRVRYLTLSGFRAAQTKPHRYMQPRVIGVPIEIYLPPMLPQSWEKLLADPSVALYFTEGELKAACGCAYGLPTIGLGGVYNWMSSKQAIPFHPTLERAEWRGRSVVILFDSDAATNVKVVQAQTKLSRELSNRGARPFLAAIPPTVDGKKQGLDDFLVTNGLEALQKVLDDAPPFLEAQALWEMSEEVVYIKNPGLIVKRENFQTMSCRAFTEHAYVNHHYFEIKETKTGNVMVQKPLAKHWLEWPQRFELERITYRPGEPQVIDNQWNQWPGWGCEPRKGDVRPWNWLMHFLFRSVPPEDREWFEQWVAYPIQHPGTKLFSSAVIWGVYQGTGKTLVAYTLRGIYGKNFIEIGDQQLTGNFNSWAENKQLVYGDEVTGTDHRAQAAKLKRMITQENLLVEAKFLPSYVLPDCDNYYFTSQYPDAFFLEDSDRRFFIHEVVGMPAADASYKEYDKWLKNGGPSFLFDYLLHLDLKDFDPKAHARNTLAKEAMISDTRSEIGTWVAAIKERAEIVLKIAYTENIAQNCDIFTTSQLFHAFDPSGEKRKSARSPTINSLGRVLKAQGFRQANEGKLVWTTSGPQRLWIIRNTEAWLGATIDSIRAHWQHFFAGK